MDCVSNYQHVFDVRSIQSGTVRKLPTCNEPTHPDGHHVWPTSHSPLFIDECEDVCQYCDLDPRKYTGSAARERARALANGFRFARLRCHVERTHILFMAANDITLVKWSQRAEYRQWLEKDENGESFRGNGKHARRLKLLKKQGERDGRDDDGSIVSQGEVERIGHELPERQQKLEARQNRLPPLDCSAGALSFTPTPQPNNVLQRLPPLSSLELPLPASTQGLAVDDQATAAEPD